MELLLEHIGSHRPWVARISGRDPKRGLRREFVSGSRDYSGSNSKGSRGIVTLYTLDDGQYEVCGGDSWGSAGKRYFIRVANGSAVKILAGDLVLE